jgi:hypothetical protein
MIANMRERGEAALKEVSEDHLPIVVRLLELLAELKGHPDIEPEELWLLATGELEKMNDEIKDAKPIDDWL